MRSIGLSLTMALLACACRPSAPPAAPQATEADAAPPVASPVAPAPDPSNASPSPPPSAPVAPAEPSPTAAATHWQCGELLVDVREAGDSVQLDFSGRSLRLPHAESLVGARYADGSGNEFMRNGKDVKFTLAGDAMRECTPSSHPSPWSAAAARGIGFRAVGSEPGWFVEVGRGETPALRATLDYGDSTVEVASTRRSGLGYAGTTANAVPVALSIQRKPCQDGMSGEAFEATAELAVGDRTYRGCGAFLAD